MEGDHVTTNNYILARWRDVITDPPPSGWCGLNIMANGARYYGACGHMPGDQWLDVTAIPAVAREAVQAAIKRIKDVQEMARGNDEYVAFGTAVDVIEEYTGVTPTEVTNG
jgi:hypothetical protein